MDTEEMYRRGLADAELGEPNPFYYQHYYHYRRGYDQARRKLGLPPPWRRPWPMRAALIAGAVIVVALLGAQLLRPRASVAPTAAAAPTAASAPTAAVPATAALPTVPAPTEAPTTVSIPLHSGGRAMVANVEGSVLRGRSDPRLNARVQVSFRSGEEVRILEGPVPADGYIWWRIESATGNGWSAQGSKEGVIWLVPIE